MIVNKREVLRWLGLVRSAVSVLRKLHYHRLLSSKSRKWSLYKTHFLYIDLYLSAPAIHQCRCDPPTPTQSPTSTSTPPHTTTHYHTTPHHHITKIASHQTVTHNITTTFWLHLSTFSPMQVPHVTDPSITSLLLLFHILLLSRSCKNSTHFFHTGCFFFFSC